MFSLNCLSFTWTFVLDFFSEKATPFDASFFLEIVSTLTSSRLSWWNCSYYPNLERPLFFENKCPLYLFVLTHFLFFIRFSMNSRSLCVLLSSFCLHHRGISPISVSRTSTFGCRHCRLVGLDGFEPSTSRLSGARSNHLSYRPFLMWLRFVHRSLYCFALTLSPFQWKVKSEKWRGASEEAWWRWWESNPWPPACRAGALPAELHPLVIKGLFRRFLISENWTTKAPYKLRTDPSIPTTTCSWKHLMVSIERRWSSRTFRYGYLVTT